MEPSAATFPIETEIRFKKDDLETQRKISKYGFVSSPKIHVCEIYGVRFFISIFPNGSQERDQRTAWVFLCVDIGNTTGVEVDIKCSVESADFSRDFKKTYKNSEGCGKAICSSEELFDTKNKYFDGNYMTLKVQGCFKFALPSGIKYPLFAQWTIKEAELEAIKTSTTCIKSKRFCISSESDLKYYFTIFPNGNKEKNHGKVLFFLFLEHPPETTVKAIYNVSIDSSNFSLSNVQCTFTNNEGCGTFCCTTEDLFNLDNGYFFDGELNLKFTGTLVIEKETKENTVMSCMKGIERKTCRKYRKMNFTLVVEGKDIEMHEHVLVEASSIFAETIKSGTKEKPIHKLDIPDFSYDVVKAGMQLLYSFPLDQKFTFEEMKSLLHFSDKYNIKLIKDHVQNYFIQNISPTNVCDLINFTRAMVDAEKLRSKCSEFLIKCMKESKPVYGLDTIDTDFGFQLFMDSFIHNLDTV